MVAWSFSRGFFFSSKLSTHVSRTSLVLRTTPSREVLANSYIIPLHQQFSIFVHHYSFSPHLISSLPSFLFSLLVYHGTTPQKHNFYHPNTFKQLYQHVTNMSSNVKAHHDIQNDPSPKTTTTTLPCRSKTRQY